ncbi:bifunctional DNA primase/polymerase [Pseudonocardia sp. GCM10023141]|uniref:bifunctional DNA primase/polymerase n=1 Tax=Pseudonocardia sp. GCM10023141 TaxID=3252653 RepID=UPI00361758DE
MTSGGVMQQNRFLDAAVAAADRGWHVFPIPPGEKVPRLREWERRATTDRRQLNRWWSGPSRRNIGIATGKSGLVVVDLDVSRGEDPPREWADARHGRDVLARLAERAGRPYPGDTYTVTSPSGGHHLYFRAPPGLELRNTVGSLGWHIDTRAGGGAIVAAGSIRRDGLYRVLRADAPAELPDWLRRALTPPPPIPAGPLTLAPARARAYVQAILDSEARQVATAEVGTRHHILLKAARTLGRLVGAGELALRDARDALLNAAARHVGVDDCTAHEVHRTIEDGIIYGMRMPRRIGHDLMGARGQRHPGPLR